MIRLDRVNCEGYLYRIILICINVVEWRLIYTKLNIISITAFLYMNSFSIHIYSKSRFASTVRHRRYCDESRMENESKIHTHAHRIVAILYNDDSFHYSLFPYTSFRSFVLPFSLFMSGFSVCLFPFLCFCVFCVCDFLI